jgi:alpha-ketoglutarate-dependent sulfate ester dioxygenase
MTARETGSVSTTVPTDFDVRPVTTVIGAEVRGVDLAQPLESAVVAEIEAALVQWKVLFFRGQTITEDQQIAFGRCFGELTPAHPVHASLEGHPEIYSVEASQLKGSRRRTAPVSEFAPPRPTQTGWHTDITFVPNPAMGSILHGVVIPPQGGDTLWSNLVAAYEDLSAPIRALIDGLHAVHRWADYDGLAKRADHDETAPPPSAVHPVVRVHPVSGERSLFVNPTFTRYIAGLSDRESRALLDLLYGQLARPEFTVRFRWEPGSVAFWDNRATAHVGPVDLGTAALDRVVQRVTIVGDTPVGPDGFRSQALVGDRFA